MIGPQIAILARATGRSSRRMAKRIPKVWQRGGAPSHVPNLIPSSVYHTQNLSLMLSQIALDTWLQKVRKLYMPSPYGRSAGTSHRHGPLGFLAVTCLAQGATCTTLY